MKFCLWLIQCNSEADSIVWMGERINDSVFIRLFRYIKMLMSLIIKAYFLIHFLLPTTEKLIFWWFFLILGGS